MQEQLGLNLISLPDQVGLRLDGVRALMLPTDLARLRPSCTKASYQRAAPAGLTSNRRSVSRRQPPSSIAAKTRFRRSADRAEGIRLSSSEGRPSNHILVRVNTRDDSSRSDAALELFPFM